MIRVGSTFSGVGGLDLGLERAGMSVGWQCESDPWKRDVLAAHWPDAHCYPDIRDVGVREGAEGAPRGRSRAVGGGAPDRDALDPRDDLGRVDLLCGGFPCQDLSAAGQRRGLAGDRSGLFFEFARALDAIRPRWMLLENVPGLFSSSDGRDFGIVLGTLADLGYGVAWRTLDAR
jgi:DNA (cytosine-5)-methyltransferase 1